MEIERQLTSQKPSISRFSEVVQQKLQELIFAVQENVRAHHVFLTQEDVEEIAFDAYTPDEITENFIQALKLSNDILKSGVHPARIYFKLSNSGLNVVTL